jgi:hypothetical protein
MMPLSTTDVQVLKLLNTPKLPASLFDNAQPINIRVLKVVDNQATILMAGRQIQTQTAIPLTAGQQLNAQPEMINGQLQLKLVPNRETNSTPQQTAQAAVTQQTPSNNNTTQHLKILNAPQSITSFLTAGQTISAQVLSTNGNQANLLVAGQTLRTQNNATLTAGQTINLLPEEIDGELRLRILPNSNQGQQITAQQPKDTSLPTWTSALPRSAKEALGSLKTSLPTQISMNELMRSLTQALPNLLSPNGENKTNLSTSWQSFLSAALTTSPAPTAEKVQQSVIDFNPKLSDNKINSNPVTSNNNNANSSEWKKDLISLINNPQTPLAEKQIAQGILAKSEQTQQIQNLHQMAGQAVLLQEIPINTAQGLDNFTLEIDVPKPETPEEERQWKIFIQLQLPEGDFTSRIQMDKDLNVRLQLWGDNDALSVNIHAQAPALKTALQEQGLTVESLIVAQGKPPSRTEQPPWHQPLVDVHG